MLSSILGHKCEFCGERSKSLDSVGGYGIYSQQRKYYHRSCLKEITCDPEHFKHTQVDFALQIVDKLKEDEEKAAWRRKEFKKNCELLSNSCIGGKED